MKFKEIVITTFLVLIVLGLFALNYIGNKFILRADSIYEVYLNGHVIGFIENDEELYKLINEKQKEIIKKYNVDNVYPPSGFKIVKTNSYNVEVSSVDDIYNRIAKLDSFTIEGYVIKVTPPEDAEKPFNIYVLDRQIFEDSMKNFVLAFIDEATYKSYIEKTQPKIETTGKIIDQMYFEENITIKKTYIDVNEKIYTNTKDLSRFLLFGSNSKPLTYTVKEGDTITSVSNENKLNPAEFLVANPKYSSVDSLLKIGDKVDVTLINPVLTFVNEINEVYDMEIPFETNVVYDNSKPNNYDVITTPGVKGLTRTNIIYEIKNGEKQSGVFTVSTVELVAKVDEVRTRGNQYHGSGHYVDTGINWGWPTNMPYVITSGYGWRWGSLHEGVDISGTGYGSPIYAIMDGEVVASGNGGMLGWQAGWNVVIKHEGNYYSEYAHMVPYSPTVQVGDYVTRGQVIGAMGMSGVATGTHLHFGMVSGGAPFAGGRTFNPCTLYVGRC